MSKTKTASHIDPAYTEGLTFAKKKKSKYTISLEEVYNIVCAEGLVVFQVSNKGPQQLTPMKAAKVLHKRIVEIE